jgi:hypothetical protein
LLKEFPDTKAVNVLTYVTKYNQFAPGFLGHYNILSEWCHPNSSGHNFMFSRLDRSDASVTYTDERDPEGNAQMIMAAIAPLPLAESLSTRLHELTFQVADLQHRVAPVIKGKPG